MRNFRELCWIFGVIDRDSLTIYQIHITQLYVHWLSVVPERTWKWGGHGSGAKHQKKFLGYAPPLLALLT